MSRDRLHRRSLLTAAAALLAAGRTHAASLGTAFVPVDAFDWSYLADTVMGGVSQGQARMEGGVLRLTGRVSTANNGGFIQTRMRLDDGLPDGARGLRLRVRGNGERYFIHIRTTVFM